MALMDDIRILERRTHVALDAAHDYYEFSRRMWDTMDELSQAGRQFRFDSKFTGSMLDETNLAVWSASHVSRNLGQHIVGRFVSILEDFIFGLLRLWLAAHPRS